MKDYKGPFDATLLLNCLLGLLVVPKESCLLEIPQDSSSEFMKWGIDPSSVQEYGKATAKNNDARNLRGLVWRLRNAVAHFRFRPEPPHGEVKAFAFHDQNGFKALIPLEQLRVFVEKLASHLRTL